MARQDGLGLPGGVPLWRARAIALGSTLRGLELPLALLRAAIIAAGLVLLVIGAWWRGALFLVAGAVMLVRRPPALRVTAKTQPELAGLVADVAAATGLRAADRVWLTGGAELEAVVTWRYRDLHIGAAMVPYLSRTQLAALTAHELSIMDHGRPWLVARLLRLWNRATQAVSSAEGPPPAAARRLAARLAPLATAVHGRADLAAAVGTGGPERAAEALLASEALRLGFLAFQADLGASRISDVHDGWRRRVAHAGVPTVPGGGPRDERAALHPGLAGALRAQPGLNFAAVLAADAVALAPLTVRDQRRLVRGLPLSLLARGRWRAFADLPPQWSIDRARRDAEAARWIAAEHLGRPPVDDIEVASALLTHREGPPDTPVERTPPYLVALAEDRLLRRGWRLEHPAVRGVFVAPDGRRIDAGAIIDGTYGEPDLARYRALLA